MKKIICALVFLLLESSMVFSANIRGLITRLGPFEVQYPVPGLTLFVRNQMNQDVSSPAITGNDGMYYFYGMFPGSYFLDVYSGYYPVGRFIINIKELSKVGSLGQIPFCDIPQIVIP